MNCLDMPSKPFPFLNRDISWLHFNGRVLQEAADQNVPLIERIKFLSIYASNLDEFYRVRVATLVRLSSLNAKSKELLGYSPKRILEEIRNIVLKQHDVFNELYESTILEASVKEDIFIIDETKLSNEQGSFVKEYFKEHLLSNLVPIIENPKGFPQIKDRTLYFYVRLTHKSNYYTHALIELPTTLERFLAIPEGKGRYVILADDIIKYCLNDIFYMFSYQKIECYSIQLTRDAELDLDKKVDDKFSEKLAKSLEKRKKGEPMRLLYDAEMPKAMLNNLVKQLDLKKDSLIAGSRYHRFSDFYNFPNFSDKKLSYPIIKPLKNKGLKRDKSLFSRIRKKDYVLHYPYQSFDYFLHFLREAAIDPQVEEIQITLYRLAADSKVAHALMNAARNGKKVFVVLELTARFDEAANLYWKEKLEEAGVWVSAGLSDYKVHSKICLITRVEGGKEEYFANLSTGNYNEQTAGLYCDHSLFTSDKQIAKDLTGVFQVLKKGKNKLIKGALKTLITSPKASRKRFLQLIKAEMKNAAEGKQAYIILKLNSLADEGIIQALYKANNAGVKIQIIVRGICCLLPGVKGFSEHIEVISIIDRFLEHARIYVFGNNGNEKMYLSSGDFMTRNLDHRVEVAFPVKDQEIKDEIRKILDLQLQDNVKARLINAEQSNEYKSGKSEVAIRSQLETYQYLKEKQI